MTFYWSIDVNVEGEFEAENPDEAKIKLNEIRDELSGYKHDQKAGEYFVFCTDEGKLTT